MVPGTICNTGPVAVIETMTFELLAGIDADDYVAFDARIQGEFSHLQPGIVRRTLARDGDTWLVESWWHSVDDATSAVDQFAAHELFAQFASMVDQQSILVSRYETT